MAASQEDVCNSALIKCGAEVISAISDNNRRARLCNQQYDRIRKKLLRSHPWNFAIKRQFLNLVTDSSSSVNAGTDAFTSVSTLNGVTGERTRITLNSGTLPAPLQQDTEYYIINLTTTTFQLADSPENAAAGIPIDITDSPVFDATFTVIPQFNFERKYFLPSDMLRAVRLADKAVTEHDLDWVIEGDFLMANEETVNLLYIADITDTTKFDESFDELFALELAHELSYPLVQSMTLKQQLKQELNEAKADIRSFDAQEGEPEVLETNEWLAVRQ